MLMVADKAEKKSEMKLIGVNGHLVVLGVMAAVLVCAWALPAPDVSNRGIADALKALEKLDRYYSHVAMPR